MSMYNDAPRVVIAIFNFKILINSAVQHTLLLLSIKHQLRVTIMHLLRELCDSSDLSDTYLLNYMDSGKILKLSPPFLHFFLFVFHLSFQAARSVTTLSLAFRHISLYPNDIIYTFTFSSQIGIN